MQANSCKENRGLDYFSPLLPLAYLMCHRSRPQGRQLHANFGDGFGTSHSEAELYSDCIGLLNFML